MADTDIVQVIAEARIDARSLSEFVFKPANFMVTRRLAPSINTLEYYLNHFRNVEAEGNNSIARANNVISAAQASVNNVISAAQASANTAINNIIIDGNAQISNAISNAGFVQVGTFAAGATLAKRNDVIQAGDGKLYRWGGSLPKTVAASSTPENSGGFGSNAWVEVSDASLSQKLAGLGGASTIGSGVSVFVNMAEFLAAESQIQDGSKVFLHSFYQGLDLGGEGRLYTYAKDGVEDTPPNLEGLSTAYSYSAGSKDKVSLATGSGFLTREFDGKVFIAEFGASGVDYDLDSPALQLALDCTRNNNGGVLSMGTECTYYLEGLFTANCSDIDWQFNGSKVYVGMFLVKWHPYKTGHGNYENIKIANATWIGNTRPKYDRTGYVHMDFVLCDDINITGCSYIEATYAGHNADLMGCREVTFEGNHVLGSCVDFSGQWFVESVQISVATSPGMPVEAESAPFFSSDYNCSGVYFRKNTYKPYINPITGIKTYPPRPIGNHSVTNNHEIYIEDNIIEDVVYQPAVNGISGAVIAFGFAGSVYVRRNKFISNTGNSAALYLVGTRGRVFEELPHSYDGYVGHTSVVVEDNEFVYNNIDSVTHALNASYLMSFDFRDDAQSDSKDRRDLTSTFKVSGNDFSINAGDANFISYSTILIETGANDLVTDVSENNFNCTGKVYRHIYLWGGDSYAYKQGGLTRVHGNFFSNAPWGVSLDLRGNFATPFELRQPLEVSQNTFHLNHRAAAISWGGVVQFSNNFYRGDTLTNPDGVQDSGYFFRANSGLSLFSGEVFINIKNFKTWVSGTNDFIYLDDTEPYLAREILDNFEKQTEEEWNTATGKL